MRPAGSPSQIGFGAGRLDRFLLLSSLMAVLTMPVFAQNPAPGELVIHYNNELAIGFTFPYLAILTPAGATRNITNAPPEGDILLAPSGNVFVASSTTPDVAIYSPAFALIGTVVTPAPTRFLAMDRGGSLYAATPAGDVNRYRPDGTLEDTFQVALDSGDEIAAGDLGRDQCTLYYFAVETNPRVRRYDVCQRQQLSDLGTASVCSGGSAPRASLRVASDGAVLVAGCVAAYRFTAQGVQTYPMPSIAIAPTADARFFWTGVSSLSLINAQTGAIVSGPIAPPASGPVTAVEIAGASRASLAAGVAIPTMSRALLLLLAVACGALGFAILRPS